MSSQTRKRNRVSHFLADTWRIIQLSLIFLVAAHATGLAQNSSQNNDAAPVSSAKKQDVVRITGVRFSYPLVQNWIDKYNEEKPDGQIIIESRGSADPSLYDIKIEAFEPADEEKKSREYFYIARYAVLPVANSHSAFAKRFSEKGLNKELIKQVYFHDIYADKDKQLVIKDPYTVYTRLQKAGAPFVFAGYFGYEQKDIKGKSIAGSDEHLLKAVLRDSTAVSYLPVNLIYDHNTGKPIDGISILPVDLNRNNKVGDDEKFYDNLITVVEALEGKSPREINNIPSEYLHFSVDKKSVSTEAIDFLRWVIKHAEDDLHKYGYLKPEPGRLGRDRFEQLATRRIK